MEKAGVGIPRDGLSDHATPALLSVVDSLVEEVVEEQVLELGFLRKAAVMSLRKTDRIMQPPRHMKSDGRVVELPVVLLGGLAQ